MATFSDWIEVDAEITASPQEIFDACSEKECTKLANILAENGFFPDDPGSGEAYFSNAESYTEQELAKALTELWRTRNLLTQSQIARILAITQESYVQ
jgi:hypothetical protein